MFLLSAQKNILRMLEEETVTSGSVNVYQVKFQFDSDWEGLEKVAVFRAGKESVSVELGESGECVLPWEVTTHNNVNSLLIIGVCGVKDGAVVLPTIWARAKEKIQAGARLGPTAMPPTPSLTEQALLEIAGERKKAEDAADRAEDAAQRAENASGGGGAGGTGNVSSRDIDTIKVIDRADFEALTERPGTTMYVILG